MIDDKVPVDDGEAADVADEWGFYYTNVGYTQGLEFHSIQRIWRNVTVNDSTAIGSLFEANVVTKCGRPFSSAKYLLQNDYSTW